MSKKTCFVVMGFGEKTDFEQGRTYDLDKTYKGIIKRAAEEAGFQCIRADEVVHSGVIDKHMYELLLNADVVVADLSTANANAIYELGIRHALKPYTTVVIAEKNFRFPFDIKSLLIRPYEHLGKGIDFEEAERAKEALRTTLMELAQKQDTDSPVYTFLPNLQMPTIEEGEPPGDAALEAAPPSGAPDQTITMLRDMFAMARSQSNWSGALLPLTQLKERLPGDPYIVQQLALATYKSKQPNVRTALDQAKAILSELHPGTSNDPETLGLWGAIHKRLWEEGGDRTALDESIRAYGKGFFLRDDHYTGINYAYMLNVRASVSKGPDAVADWVWAERVRCRVAELCQALQEAGVKDDEGNEDREALFWLRATQIEALAGSGRGEDAEQLKAKAIAEAPEAWMGETLTHQLEKLQQMLGAPPKIG